LVVATYDARFTGQVFPKRNYFYTSYVSVRDGQSTTAVVDIKFELVSGVPGNGTYEAEGHGLLSTGSAVGTRSFDTRIDPVANGYGFVGTDAAASFTVMVLPLQ
jgi:hypothetical protein